MAKTKVVNPRSKPRKKPRRRRNTYGAAAKPAPRRRRRRNPAPARRRRSAPQRRRNPAFGLDTLVTTMPPATAGVLFSRWAVSMAGDMEVRDGQPVPGLRHAFAVWITALFGGNVLGRVMSKSAGDYFKVAALGFGGDLFLRKWFLADSTWANNHLYLDGSLGNASRSAAYGRRPGLGQGASRTWTDAVGNRYVWTSRGWQLSGGMGALYTRSPLMGPGQQATGNMGALMERSPLAGGDGARSGGSSFGYS